MKILEAFPKELLVLSQICFNRFYEITIRKDYLLENPSFDPNTIYIYKNKPTR